MTQRWLARQRRDSLHLRLKTSRDLRVLRVDGSPFQDHHQHILFFVAEPDSAGREREQHRDAGPERAQQAGVRAVRAQPPLRAHPQRQGAHLAHRRQQ
ncbi:hypothetical protein ANN_12081 [Periplaneta americana]|uniref:Uncharacterized protein n=1 Tax=Periplaneta americana TaxID=6978 RepID=A0ABQ8T949_PERAM|nr:hypothetical protein ANN_12081 [Periplaneta americana]